jgi:hypothetical protein
MAALTLIEASKELPVGAQRAALQLYADSYQPLQQMGFIDSEPGGTVHWTIEDTLGSIGGRAIGSDFTPSNGTEKPFVAMCATYGGKVQVDRVIRTIAPGSVPTKKANKIRGFAYQWVKDMFEGQGGTSLKGISHWIANEYTSQSIDHSGAVITMAQMDALYDKLNVVPGKSFFYMGQTPFLALNVLSRTNGTGQQNIIYQQDAFGRRVPFYNDVPIVVLKDAKGVDILSTAETSTGAHTGGVLCSIYGVTYGDSMFTGFQAAPMTFIDFKDDTNFENFTMEHIAGVAPFVTRSVARIYDVKNALT